MSKPLNENQFADLIERFLNGRSNYPQEWNDLVDHGIRVENSVKSLRDRCDELDPLVNRPDPQDPAAIAELRQMIVELRAQGA